MRAKPGGTLAYHQHEKDEKKLLNTSTRTEVNLSLKEGAFWTIEK